MPTMPTLAQIDAVLARYRAWAEADDAAAEAAEPTAEAAALSVAADKAARKVSPGLRAAVAAELGHGSRVKFSELPEAHRAELLAAFALLESL